MNFLGLLVVTTRSAATNYPRYSWFHPILIEIQHTVFTNDTQTGKYQRVAFQAIFPRIRITLLALAGKLYELFEIGIYQNDRSDAPYNFREQAKAPKSAHKAPKSKTSEK